MSSIEFIDLVSGGLEDDNEITPPATIELLNRGMERFDYTKWQREHFDKTDLHSFVDSAASFAKENGK